MKDFIVIKDGKPVTTSLKVAKLFHREHKSVLRSIRKTFAANESTRKFFKRSTYLNKQCHQQPMYYMSHRGFMILTMGFTGKRAVVARNEAIKAFEQTESTHQGEPASQAQSSKKAVKEVLSLESLASKLNKIEKKVNRTAKDIILLKDQLPIDQEELHELKKARSDKFAEVSGGTKSKFYRQDGPFKIYGAFTHDFKEHFVIRDLEDLRRSQFFEAMKYTAEWQPSISLKQEIESTNQDAG